jgi:hypothetical protein
MLYFACRRLRGRYEHTLIISGTRDAITSRIEIAVDWNTRRRNCYLFA